MSRVVAVVCAYWPSRFDNVRTIVKDLNSGTTVPDRILVLNNNPGVVLRIDGADVINSEFNSRSRGKLVACLLDVADYYLLLDDDTSVSPKTLEKYMSVAHRESCYAYCGIEFGGGNGNRVYPLQIEEETPVEYFLGCGIFTSFYCLVRSLMLDERLRRDTEWKHQAEDITFGLANSASILPLKEDEMFIDLDWGDKAMAWGNDNTSEGGGDYLVMRNKVKAASLKALEKNLPEF